MIAEYIIIQKPTDKEKKDGKLEKILAGPKVIVTKNDKAAGMIAIKQFMAAEGADIKDEDFANVEVLVRPFA